ncbi:hypothetical protein [Rhodopirellula baltica]|nr:hypothetical protein [Rhodopirellula baltica]
MRSRIEADLHSMGAYYVSFDDSNSPSWVGFVAPVGLDRIERYESFDDLDFSGANINDDTVRDLSNLKSVRVLHLTDCNVTDDQLEMLAPIGSVWMLRLNGSPVTDDAIPAIASIRGLKSLDVSGTLITSAGVAELQQRCPEIVVRHEPR